MSGAKFSGQLRRQAVATEAEHVHFFLVISQSMDEIILGEDDRGHDFRVSLLLRQKSHSSGAELIALTIVIGLGLMDRAYIFALTLSHWPVIRTNLAATARD
ncbi:DUF2867 domain-containing protein [Acidocella aminolytica]|uniref:DUF2867 domain-containing protein n=1 Tax=Acidocella aminolytica TaxID=33998 RepID=UPI002232CA18|nr:DUF2867 domain-containing protein [Acidocella aminolytica]